mmetsp:Transcript_26219/g.41043  ORF Transcript_26219/g.41043 Transcript_26219/m.41043 type:complete len:235 (-) Transcript_26219:168-872(-)
MGQQMSNPCCGREKFDKDGPSMPLRRITALQDARVHFINDAPMICVLRERLWEVMAQHYVVKDVNGISLFQVEGLNTPTKRLLLPGGICHAVIERGLDEDEWHIYVGEERRVTVLRKVVANNVVFLVHVLVDPFPVRGSASNLPLPTLSVRGDFHGPDFWLFDCSDLHGRKVAHCSNQIPENQAIQLSKGMYAIDVAPGLDVALVIAICLVVDDCFLQGKIPKGLNANGSTGRV